MSSTRIINQSTLAYASIIAAPTTYYGLYGTSGADYKVSFDVLSQSVLGNRQIGANTASAITTNNGTQTLTNKTLTSPTITSPSVTAGTFTQPILDRPSIDKATVTSGSFTNIQLTTPYVNGYQIANANGTLIDQCSGLSGNIQSQLDLKLYITGGSGRRHTNIPYYTASFTGVTSKNFTGNQILSLLGFSTASYFVCADEGVFVEAYTRTGTAGAYVYNKDTTVDVKIYTITNSVLAGDDLIVTTCSVTGLAAPSTYRISMMVSILSYI